MPDLRYTSVPQWALDGAAVGEPDEGGTALLLGGVGHAGRARVETWAERAATRPVIVLTGDEVDEVARRLARAIGDARVGLRVRVAGPAGACLVLRGVAIAAGLEDDEIHIAPDGGGPIRVSCAHCHATTSATAAIGEVVSCAGCGRGLVVYYHVSRRTGAFLGYMLEAESGAA